MQLSVGEQLKNARTIKSASIEQAAEATHIRPHLIQAIEAGDYTDIPSKAQIKGFIRLYATWLGLNPTLLLDIFDGKSPTPDLVVESLSEDIENPNQLPVDILEETELSTSNIEELTPDLPSDNHPIPDVKTDGVASDSIDEIGEHSSMTLFAQIGVNLKGCREGLKISLNDVEKLTHIRTKYLAAMEDGNFNEIPSLVQARGLLSGYAKFLNLDVDKQMSIFADALQKRRIEMLPPEAENKKKTENSTTTNRERSGLARFFSLDLILGGIVIVGLVGFGIWAAAQVMSSDSFDTVATAPPISDVLLQNPTSETNINITITSEPSEIARNPDQIGQIPQEAPAEAPNTSDEEPTPLVPNLGDASMQVYIVPNQRVFLQVNIGKKVVFTGRTVPGNAYPFTADDNIEVISGNAAALQIYYNQRDLGTLGLPGEPLRLIFSKEGITTPTPANTPMPTLTPLPTLTLRPTATSVPPTVTPLLP